MNSKIYLIILLIFNFGFVHSQTSEIDSLKKVVDTISIDSLKIKTLSQIGYMYSYQNADSSIKYFKQAIKLAKDLQIFRSEVLAYINLGYVYIYQGQYSSADSLFDLANNIAINSNFKKGQAESIYSKGIIHDYKGEYTEANEYYLQALEITPSKRDSARYYIVIGNVHIRRAYYILALEAYQTSLKMMQDIRYRYGIATCYLNIGNVYLDQNEFKKALSSYIAGLVIYKKMNNLQSIAVCYNNIGTVLDHSGNYKTAFGYYLKTLEYYTQANDIYGVAHTYSNIATCFAQDGNYDSAFYYFNEAEQLKIDQQDNEGLLIIYNSMGSTYKDMGNYSLAIKYSLKSYEMAKQIESLSRQREAVEVLADAYSLNGDFKNAFIYEKRFKELHDSIYNEENQKKLTQQEVKFEYDSKIKIQRIEQKRLKQLHQAELKRQNVIKTAFIIGFMLLFFLLFFVYRAYLIKRKSNILIREQNNEIEQKNVELEQQKEEIMAQSESIEIANVEITKQKQALELSHKHVTDSINYASRIQNAIFTDDYFFSDFFSDYFIFLKPRDIVSGDFYWLKQTEKHILLAVADCTGHGVPGAFMSVLGISLLNEILRREDIFTAAETLEFLRKNVKLALKQTGNEDEQKDGMDMAFVAIDKNLKSMQYAGANNPLYITRKNELIEYKSTRNPIGIYVKEKPFVNNTIELEKDDQIYLFSDGYIDQFNGENMEKFKVINFKKMITDISDKPMTEQKNIIDRTLIQWQNNFKQVDDILIVGIKI
ncbi:MAG: tetratricopeptide repeat protein [Bacteroidales bacterium]|nr:tetratricopeptide repeat protein [Bacteroidales bacterium]